VFATTKVTSTAEEEILLGNPSNATTNALNSDYFSNYLLSKPQYCLSFNNTTHNTNWTSWHLFLGDLGSAARSSSFSADASLPAGFYQVANNDYSYATYGFERGHMCPSADRTSDDANNLATFVMSNAVPQSPNCNGIVWGSLEDYCRTLVNQGNELYIVCGPYGQGGTAKPNGTGSETSANFVNNNAGGTNIVVPAQVWKIIVVIPNGNDDISRITTATRVIAVIMPNTVGCSAYDWKHYRTSVRALETLTGFNFLSNVPQSIQDVIETVVDNQ
jgi:endonuclease G, mitochondrial